MQDTDNGTELVKATQALLVAISEIAKAETTLVGELNEQVERLIEERLNQIHNLRQARNEYGTRLAILERFGK